MAVYKHGVTSTDVLDDLPVSTKRATSTSDGLNTIKIDNWIGQGAGQLNAILSRHGFATGSLGDNESELVKTGIIAYAAAKSGQVVALNEEAINRYWETFNNVRSTLKETPQDMGESQLARNQIHSNLSGSTGVTGSASDKIVSDLFSTYGNL